MHPSASAMNSSPSAIDARRHAAVDVLEGPDLGGFRNVADFGGVDASEHALAAAVQRILADRHVNAVVVEHGRADDFAGADVSAVVAVAAIFLFVAGPIVDELAVFVSIFGRIAVERPDFVQKCGLGAWRCEGPRRRSRRRRRRRKRPAACRPRGPATATTTARGTPASRSSRRLWPPAGRCACQAR